MRRVTCEGIGCSATLDIPAAAPDGAHWCPNCRSQRRQPDTSPIHGVTVRSARRDPAAARARSAIANVDGIARGADGRPTAVRISLALDDGSLVWVDLAGPAADVLESKLTAQRLARPAAQVEGRDVLWSSPSCDGWSR